MRVYRVYIYLLMGVYRGIESKCEARYDVSVPSLYATSNPS